jgi:excisionase family DNA binding protein
MSIDEILKEQVRREVRQCVTETLEPVAVLKDFAGVDQLTIEEVCRVFRREPTEASKNWIRERCKNGEIPFVKLGESYLFPKNLLAKMLCGEWSAEKREKKRKNSYGLRDAAREFVQ